MPFVAEPTVELGSVHEAVGFARDPSAFATASEEERVAHGSFVSKSMAEERKETRDGGCSPAEGDHGKYP